MFLFPAVLWICFRLSPSLFIPLGFFSPLKNDLTLLVLLPRMPLFARQTPSLPPDPAQMSLFYKARLFEPVLRINHALN